MLEHNELKTIKAMIMDMDGVLWRADEPIGDLPSLFGRINDLGIKYAFATNNAGKSVDQYINKFKSFQLDINASQIVSSSLVAADFLMDKYPSGGRVYIVGEEGLVNTMSEYGFKQAEDNVQAVVVGMDRGFNYEKLSKACRLIWDGSLFIGTNPDSSYPTPDGLAPGAGAIIAAIQTATGITPLIMGKPFPTIIQKALKGLNSREDECLVVGDRMDTDIMAGKNAGCLTALVLSGVGKLTDIGLSSSSPDYVFANLEELIAKIEVVTLTFNG